MCIHEKKNAMICSYMVSYSIEFLLLLKGCSLGSFDVKGLCKFSVRVFHSLSHFHYTLGGMRTFCESFEFYEIFCFLD